jgi:subtilisin family serine protease
MKEHIVVKLRTQSPTDAGMPGWQEFIQDKSMTRESLDPDIDRIFQENGLKFWATKEYTPSGGGWSAEERLHGLNRTYRLILQNEYDLPKDLVDHIRLVPGVEGARGIQVGEAEFPHHELSTESSIAPQNASELIYGQYAKAFTRGLPKVRIAVLDTGVNLSHKELEGKIAQGADFVNLDGLDTSAFIGDFKDYDSVPEDEVGHGTHVSGIIAAKGVAMDEGLAPGCSLLAVRVLATMKSGDRLVGAGIIDNINAGIKWAVDNGADVINMSLGIRHEGGGLPHEDVIKYALSKNVTIVAASGNDGTSEKYYPGALPGVIAVGAVDLSGTVTSFTSYGANISVVAPGVNIYSSFSNNRYAFASGTSQASPFVCATIGLMKSYAREKGRSLSNSEIRHILKHTSDRVDSRLRNEHAGYGLINLADGFKLLDHILN